MLPARQGSQAHHSSSSRGWRQPAALKAAGFHSNATTGGRAALSNRGAKPCRTKPSQPLAARQGRGAGAGRVAASQRQAWLSRAAGSRQPGRHSCETARRQDHRNTNPACLRAHSRQQLATDPPHTPETRSAATRSPSGSAQAPADLRVISWQASAGIACTSAGPYPRCTSTSTAVAAVLLLLPPPLLLLPPLLLSAAPSRLPPPPLLLAAFEGGCLGRMQV